ncbi:MAG TPA: FecR domain-containing protein [Terriglobales bacterium]|nr:FecR domain-containing protein [Terriglobales bacterium]
MLRREAFLRILSVFRFTTTCRWTCCMVLLACATGMAQDAGKVGKVIPAGFIIHEKTASEAKAADPVYLNDVLRTNANGRMRVELRDGSVLSVGAKSELRVVTHNTESQQTMVEMLYGKLRGSVTPVTKPGGKFSIRTPTAVIGVVGTTVAVETLSTASSQTVTAAQIENLPTSRNPVELLRQTPGVVPPPSGQQGSKPPMQVDGIPVDGAGPPTSGQQPVVEDIQVQRGPSGAEFGSATGGVINSLTHLPPGREPYKDAGPTLADYKPVNATLVACLGGIVIVAHNNPAFAGFVILLPGEYIIVERDKPLGTVQRLFDGPPQDYTQPLMGHWGELDGGASDGACSSGAIVVNGRIWTGPNKGSSDLQFKFRITGTGTSTGNALVLWVKNESPCALVFIVTDGAVLEPKGFVGKVILGLAMGDMGSIKSYQKMLTWGGYVMVAMASPPMPGALNFTVPADGEVSIPLRSYCLELHKQAPHPKTEYKFADADDQQKLGTQRKMIESALRLALTGRFKPGRWSALDSVIQWSVWADREGMDFGKFRDEFLNLVEKNYKAQKKKWDKQAKSDVEAGAKELWDAVQLVTKNAAT